MGMPTEKAQNGGEEIRVSLNRKKSVHNMKYTTLYNFSSDRQTKRPTEASNRQKSRAYCALSTLNSVTHSVMSQERTTTTAAVSTLDRIKKA